MSQTARVHKYATHTGRESTSLRAFHARPRPLTYAKYATRPVPCVKPPLYWHFDAPKITESHRLNGTLMPLELQCLRTKFFIVSWEKSCFYKKAEIPRMGIPAFYFLSAQRASIFIRFFLKYRIPQHVSNWRSQYGLNEKNGKYTCRA